MKYIKKFESFNKDEFEELFISHFYDLCDKYNLFRIKDKRFLTNGHLFINSDNFHEGYFFHSNKAIDKEAKNINLNRDHFNIKIIKKSHESFPAEMDHNRAMILFRKEYPDLYIDINNYINTIKNLHKRDEYEFSDRLSVLLIQASDFKFYEIDISFDMRELKYKETPHYRTLSMLKQLYSDDDEMKSKLKEIGFDLNESTKVKNITKEDIIKCIKKRGKILADTIDGLPNNDPNDYLKPTSIDNDGLVTIEYKGKEYEVKLKNITSVDI